MSEIIKKTKEAFETGEGVAQIPFYVHEGEMWRLERINKRLMWGTVAAMILLVGTNLFWALRLM